MPAKESTPAGPNPGVLFVNSKITKPELLSEEEYARWYEKVHIPDIFKTSGIGEANRFKALGPDSERPFLALYPLQDLDYLQSDEFKAIPVTDSGLPGSHKIFELADFDTRYYKHVQTIESTEHISGPPNLLIVAAFTPADDEEYERFYREQHNEEVSRVTGWRKSDRYALTFAWQNRKPAEENELPKPPKFLTLHFFDGEELPEADLQKSGEAETTKKMLATMKQSQIGAFKRLSYHSE